jgi:hypothetical protein
MPRNRKQSYTLVDLRKALEPCNMACLVSVETNASAIRQELSVCIVVRVFIPDSVECAQACGVNTKSPFPLHTKLDSFCNSVILRDCSKSQNLSTPEPLNKILDGFRSQYRIPLECKYLFNLRECKPANKGTPHTRVQTRDLVQTIESNIRAISHPVPCCCEYQCIGSEDARTVLIKFIKLPPVQYSTMSHRWFGVSYQL